MKMLLLENIHPAAVERLEEAGYSVETVKGALDEDDLIAAVKGVHVLGIRSKTTVSRRVLEEADKLMAVAAFCIGVNQIDLDALFGALGVMAGSQPTMNNFTFGNERHQYYETISGGTGGPSASSGASAVITICASLAVRVTRIPGGASTMAVSTSHRGSPGRASAGSPAPSAAAANGP